MIFTKVRTLKVATAAVAITAATTTEATFEKISPDDEYAKDMPKTVKEKIKDNITKRSKSTILLKWKLCYKYYNSFCIL